MEGICSSDMSDNFQLTKRRHIPEDRLLHNHRCDNLKYCKLTAVNVRMNILTTTSNIQNPIAKNAHRMWKYAFRLSLQVCNLLSTVAN
jgi:hypothetical protein